MVVYICCANSGTSFEFARMIKKQLNNDDKILIDFMSNVTRKYENNELKNYKLILAHGSGFVSIPAYFIQQKFKELVKIVYLMPQVAFNLPKFKEALEPLGIHCRALQVSEMREIMKNESKVVDVLREDIKKYSLECDI